MGWSAATMPTVIATFATSTSVAQANAILELPCHPLANHLFFCTGLPGDDKNGVGVVARGSGVYAVALLRSGLK
jgi:hypothetical protein